MNCDLNRTPKPKQGCRAGRAASRLKVAVVTSLGACVLSAIAGASIAHADAVIPLPPLPGTTEGRPWPAAISESGQVVGEAGNVAYSWTQAGGAVGIASGLQNTSRAEAVNGSGQVVGHVEGHGAFSWTGTGGLVLLEPLEPESNAYLINESGEVAGRIDDQGFVWTPLGGFVHLGSLGGGETFPEGINRWGEVSGTSRTGSGFRNAFVWTPTGGMIDLGTLGGRTSYGGRINDAGEVVGGSVTADGAQHGFVWSASRGMEDLGTLGGPNSQAVAINDTGEIVGSADTSKVVTDGFGEHYEHYAFSWTRHGGMVDLGTLPGGVESWATAVNGSGQVVGGARVPADRNWAAFSWTKNGGMVELAGGARGAPVAINGAGQVIGGGPVGLGPVLWDTNPPAILATEASASAPTTGVVRASVEPKDQSTTVHVDYAPAVSSWCASHGREGSPTETSPQSIGSSYQVVSGVQVSLEGLTPGTKYCARLIATNEAGTSDGDYVSFRTRHRSKGSRTGS